MATEPLEQRMESLAKWWLEAGHPVVFTGAGMSTESNLPDFRGPDGIWTRQEKGLPTQQIDFSKASPNAGHVAIYDLQEMGKLGFLISQNVDNLHLASGVRPELLAELHGNVTKQRCGRCDFVLDNHGDTECPLCGGQLKSSVVGFGQAMPQKELEAAYHHAKLSDLFVVVGSSLVVFPAADMPQIARRKGAKLVIINQGETPMDSKVHLRFDESTGDVLTGTVSRLKQLMHW
jgi:NAD-dependent deacetylase